MSLLVKRKPKAAADLAHFVAKRAGSKKPVAKKPAATKPMATKRSDLPDSIARQIHEQFCPRGKSAKAADASATAIVEAKHSEAPLSTPEKKKLLKLETEIQTGAFAVGEALAAIRDERLYRESHGTFEAYLLARWGIGRQEGYRQIQQYEAAAIASPIGGKLGIEFTAASQVRPLIGLDAGDVKQVLQAAKRAAPKTAGDEPLRLTAAQIETARKKVLTSPDEVEAEEEQKRSRKHENTKPRKVEAESERSADHAENADVKPPSGLMRGLTGEEPRDYFEGPDGPLCYAMTPEAAADDLRGLVRGIGNKFRGTDPHYTQLRHVLAGLLDELAADEQATANGRKPR